MIDYLPWRRLWKETMGEGFADAVQLVEMKNSLPKRSAQIIGLQNIRSMANFWALMDDEFVNYKELAKKAIEDIKQVDTTDTRFLQLFKNKLDSRVGDLQQVDLAHRITADEMIEDYWLPMLLATTVERWLQDRNQRQPG